MLPLTKLVRYIKEDHNVRYRRSWKVYLSINKILLGIRICHYFSMDYYIYTYHIHNIDKLKYMRYTGRCVKIKVRGFWYDCHFYEKELNVYPHD
jgi:hypothetical protein